MSVIAGIVVSACLGILFIAAVLLHLESRKREAAETMVEAKRRAWK